MERVIDKYNHIFFWEQQIQSQKYVTIPMAYHDHKAQPSRGTKRTSDKEHIITKQTPHMKPQTDRKLQQKNHRGTRPKDSYQVFWAKLASKDPWCFVSDSFVNFKTPGMGLMIQRTRRYKIHDREVHRDVSRPTRGTKKEVQRRNYHGTINSKKLGWGRGTTGFNQFFA